MTQTQDASFKPIRSTGQRIYRYWQALYKSFYSPALYADVGKNWRGLGIVYLLLMLCLFCIPFTIRVAFDLNHAFQAQLFEPLSQMPVVYIQKGKLLFNQPSPYFIKNHKNQVVAIIDASGTINQIDDKYPDLSILISKNRLLMKLPSPQISNAQALEEVTKPMERIWGSNENLVFDPKSPEQLQGIKNYQYLLTALLYPMVLSTAFSIFLLILMILGLLGQVFATIFYSFSLSFMTSTRLLIVSSTPALLLLLSAATFRLQAPWLGFAVLLLLSGYFAFAVFSLKAQSKRLSL